MVDDAFADVWKKLFGDYSDAFLDHSFQPRNVGQIPDASVQVYFKGSCGDSIELWFKEREGKISEITFISDGCEGTTACGSAVTELAKGKSLEQAAAIDASMIERFLEDLAPEHKHCAELAASALHNALAKYKMRKEIR